MMRVAVHPRAGGAYLYTRTAHPLPRMTDVGLAECGSATSTSVPRINNVVATLNVGKQLDLLKFSQEYGFEFQPSRFAACSLRLKNTDLECRSTALAFTSGKFVITTRSELKLCWRQEVTCGFLTVSGSVYRFWTFTFRTSCRAWTSGDR